MIKNLKFLFSLEQITCLLLGSKQGRKTESKMGSQMASPKSRQLRELKKIRLFYGSLPLKYLKKIIRKTRSFPPFIRNETLFTILESRLDVILYRSTFFESIATAKQWILTQGVYLNKKKVVSPGTTVVPGDNLSIFKTENKLLHTISQTSDIAKRSFANVPPSISNHFVFRPKKKYLVSDFRTIYKNNLSISSRQGTQSSTLFYSLPQKKKVKEIKSNTIFLLKKKVGNWRFKISAFKRAFFRSYLKDSSKRSLHWRKSTTLKKGFLDRALGPSVKLLFSKQYWDSIDKSWLGSLQSSALQTQTQTAKISKIVQVGDKMQTAQLPTAHTEKKINIATSALFRQRRHPVTGFVRHCLEELRRGAAYANKTDSTLLSKTELCFAKSDSKGSSFSEKENEANVYMQSPFTKQSRIFPEGKTKLTTKKIRLQSSALQESRIYNFLFQNYKQFLKKQCSKVLLNKQGIRSFVISHKYRKRKTGPFLRSTIDMQNKSIPDLSDLVLFYTKLRFVSDHLENKKQKKRPFRFKFLPSYFVKVKKEKANCFSKQKSKYFFKEQFLFASKQIKPLHLEISYKSLSTIFLFQPQRIYFPFFIDISQIYK